MNKFAIFIRYPDKTITMFKDSMDLDSAIKERDKLRDTYSSFDEIYQKISTNYEPIGNPAHFVFIQECQFSLDEWYNISDNCPFVYDYFVNGVEI